jgi:3-dehydroquinate synthetase
MPAMSQTIRVNLAERSYDIAIGTGNLADAGRFLVDRAKVTHVVLITDDNVQKPHAMQVAESLGEQDIEVDVICVEPGEESKSLEMAEALWQGLLDLDADRKTVVAAVGGGVVGDLAGFIAATFARGLRFLQVPTSLLAQVDSSVGGKVGINLPDAKNMVGAFLQPLGVLIDTATLATLPPREFCAGLGEVVKYGVILDAELFDYLEANAAALIEHDRGVLARVIARCCRLKADVVEQDEREESGLRAILNFGHTFGHAFETLSWHVSPLPLGEEPGMRANGGSGFSTHPSSLIPHPSSAGPHPNPLPKREGTGGYGAILHGEAVAIGMVCAARLAERLGRVDAAFTPRLRSLLETFGLPVKVPAFDPQQIFDSMMHDKKVQYGQLSFVLPNRMGRVELVRDIAEEDILAAIEER